MIASLLVGKHDAALHARAAALAGIGSWQCDLRTDALTWTGEVFDLFGIPRGEKLHRPDVVWMYDEQSRDELERLRSQAIRTCGRFTMDARIVQAGGAARWTRIVAGTIPDCEGRAVLLYGLQHDVTDERERWDAMRRLAERDALTGLFNRGMFQARFLDCPFGFPALAPAGALMLVDVDGFKQVNDCFGHAAGDHCLRLMAERLSAGFPDARMIARIGGDEFAVILPAVRDEAAIGRALHGSFADLCMPVAWHGRILDISASAGIARIADPGAFDAEATFAAADAALYLAKHAGRGTYRIAGTGIVGGV
ncbi:MAG: diguanylate cyclase [Sphingomonas bacterium]|nr:diguanylate cyclase [Sphingomonas bacterium]MDB5690376.1 diguanylate cyclase [Sphingomonas bacterium]